MRRPRFAESWLPGTVVLGLGLVAACGVAWQTHQANERLLRTTTQQMAEASVNSVLAQVERAVLGLRGARGYLMGAGVDRSDARGFRAYFETRDLPREFPGVTAVGFIRRVAESRESDFVAQARRQGEAGFTIQTLSPHAGERRVIQWAEPLESARGAIGLDIASEPARQRASDLALRDGGPVLTAPIRLVQTEPGGSMGLLMLLAMPGTDASAGFGVTGPSGFVYSPVRLDRLLKAAHVQTEQLNLQVEDVTEPGAPVSFDLPAPARAQGSPVALQRSVMGRQWRFTVTPTPQLIASISRASPWLQLAAGALLSLLAAAVTQVWLRLRQRTRDALDERIRLSTMLDHASDAIVGLDRQGRVVMWNRTAAQLFGYSTGEVLGQPVSALLWPLDADEGDRKLLRDTLAGQVTQPFETRRRRKDGSLVDVELSLGPMFDGEGQVVGAAKVLRPIAERLAQARRLQAYSLDLERQVAERTAELAQTSRDLRAVLDAMPSSIAGWDRNLRLRLANRAYGDFFGRPPEQLLGAALPELLGPDVYELSRPNIEAVLRGEEQHFERVMPGPAGQGQRHLLVHYLPSFSDGQQDGFYVVAHDVTDVISNRVALDTLRREQQALMRTIDEHSIFSVADRRGTILSVNDGFCAISGYEREELVGQNHRVINSGYHPREFWVDMWRTISSGRPWQAEVCNRAKDGSLYWVNSVIAPFFDADGRIEKYVSLRTDVTERRRAEAELQRTLTLLRSVLEASTQVAIVATQLDGRVTLFNRGAEALLAYAADEVIDVMQVQQFHDAAELQQRGELLSERLGRSVPPAFSLVQPEVLGEPFECSYVRKDGSQVPVSLWVTAMRDDAGSLAGFLNIAVDLTLRRLYESSLHDAMDEARRASRAKSEFLASTSHEIRTPLNAIIGLAYLLERTVLPPREVERVRQIAQAGRSLLGLINDVLDLSKIEAGKLDLDEQDFDLRALLHDEMSLLSAGLEDGPVRTQVQVDDDVPLRVHGDMARLRQIVINLVGNALKFTKRGLVTLRVRPGDGPAMLVFEVEDTGPGIAPEVRSRLFQPFMQGDASTTRQHGGTGLGLAITARLVSLMGGQIDVESQPGVGSCFRFELALPESQLDDSGGLDSTDPLRVLVAEDDANERAALVRLTRMLGWQTVAVEGGEAMVAEVEAMAHRRQPFDALVVDWQMPDLDGLRALARLGERLPHEQLPATVVVSAHEIERLRAAPHAELAANLLVKPVSASTLFNAVNEALARMPERAMRVLDQSSVGHGDMMWLQGMRVLIADDSLLNLDVARHVLELEGARVVTCTSGEQALARLLSMPGELDAVLVDVQMPGMDGLEVVRRLRQEPELQRLPVIALTAGVLRSERDSAFAAGMSDFLPKPLEPQRLIRCLRRHVERYRGEAVPVIPRVSAAAQATSQALHIDGLDTARIAPSVLQDQALVLSMLKRLLTEFGDIGTTPRGELPARLHKLRGSAQVVGAMEVARAAGELEKLARDQSEADVVAPQAALAERMAALATAAAPELERERLRLEAAQAEAAERARANGLVAGDDTVRELLELIDQQSLQALERVEALAGPLASLLEDERLRRLHGALQEFDFRAAREVLMSWVTRQA
ncbi:MAG: hypothetical protein DI603_19940 [Roseateles depolymerans]|uniref:Virulence sensor protein BvgS n=1 Tax=Roseateles depolymerans TaxID=76731 RepID=A0A2W5DIJ0_9BURK|nr:MAG: hypothetical protein DI603_19940 [Roseateles depolymerans]